MGNGDAGSTLAYSLEDFWWCTAPALRPTAANTRQAQSRHAGQDQRALRPALPQLPRTAWQSRLTATKRNRGSREHTLRLNRRESWAEQSCAAKSPYDLAVSAVFDENETQPCAPLSDTLGNTLVTRLCGELQIVESQRWVLRPRH